MEILNALQVTQTQFKTKLSDRPRPDYVMRMDALRVGEGLRIEKSEWKLTTPPNISHAYVKSQGKKFRCRTLADASGWVIIRIA